MSAREETADHLREMLAPLGPVAIRRMFGGFGVFLDGLMLGLVIDDVLYFKVDDGNRAAFEAEGMAPFSYAKRTGKMTVLSFWQAPERLYDEPDEMVAWARDAIAVARRAAAGKDKVKHPARKAGGSPSARAAKSGSRPRPARRTAT